MENPSPLKEIKQQFYTYRNGALADTLRKYGDPHRIIFGLDVPQIASIARSLAPGMELATLLWTDRDVRESRLLAAYLFPLEEISLEKALELCSDLRNREEADILAFRLLKRLPYATDLHTSLRNLQQNGPQSYRLAYEALTPHLS